MRLSDRLVAQMDRWSEKLEAKRDAIRADTARRRGDRPPMSNTEVLYWLLVGWWWDKARVVALAVVIIAMGCALWFGWMPP